MEETKQVLVVEDTVTPPVITPEQAQEIANLPNINLKGVKAIRRGTPGAFGKCKNKPE